MATSSQNRIVRSPRPGSIFESALKLISSSSSWNQGDLIYLDTTAHILNAVTSDTTGATCMGIARQTIVSGKLVQPYVTAVDASQAIEDVAGPQYGVIASMKLKSGDVFVPGQSVYASSVDAQTVSASGTNAIGIFQDAQITAAASSVGNCLLGARVGAGLQF